MREFRNFKTNIHSFQAYNLASGPLYFQLNNRLYWSYLYHAYHKAGKPFIVYTKLCVNDLHVFNFLKSVNL